MHLPAMHLLFLPHDWFSLSFWHTGGLAFVLQDWQVGAQAGLQAAGKTRQAKQAKLCIWLWKVPSMELCHDCHCAHQQHVLGRLPKAARQAPHMQCNQGARNSLAGGM